MRKMIKVAIGLAALGFIGLIGLGMLGIIWSVAAPGFEQTQGTVYEPYAEYGGSMHNGKVAWVQTNPSMTWFGVVVRTGGLFFIFLLALLIALRFARIPNVPPKDDTALVHELARRAQDLSERMESLETILLDRTRATR